MTTTSINDLDRTPRRNDAPSCLARRHGIWVKGLLAVAVIVGAAFATDGGRASAAITRAWGSAGGAGVPQNIAARGYHGSTITMPPRMATESPRFAGRDQYVCATYRWFELRRRMGQPYWHFMTSARECGWITPAQDRIRFNGATFTGLGFVFGNNVDVVYTWRLANGTEIGRRLVDSVHERDYRCVTAGCVTGTSEIGGFVLFTF